MDYEVEQKYRVNDALSLALRAEEMGGSLSPSLQQVDRYYNHPARDFGETDEAFRLRRAGSKCWVTYKGPRIDKTTKTRRELELPLPDDSIEHFDELYLALGFRFVAEVAKERRKNRWSSNGFEVEFVLDSVTSIGTFCELEIVTPEERLSEAKQVIQGLACELRLGEPVLTSYLELVLEQMEG